MERCVIFAEAATRVDHEFSTAVVKMKPQETFAAENEVQEKAAKSDRNESKRENDKPHDHSAQLTTGDEGQAQHKDPAAKA